MKSRRIERRSAKSANVVLLSLLALPCLLVLNADAGMWPLNLLGAVYTYWFAMNLKEERFSDYIDDTSDLMN